MFRGRFVLNALTGQGNPFWPDKLLGAGCARWAQQVTMTFIDAFFSRLDLPAPYDNVRAELVQDENSSSQRATQE